MTDIALLGRGDMIAALACGNVTVVTARADPNDLGVIYLTGKNRYPGP